MASEARGEHAGVWLVTGIQGAGKTTIADLLARRFDHGVHVRGGQFYRWAVRGWLQPGQEPADEARRMLELRYRLAAKVADEYAAAGFITVVQDNIYGTDVADWLGSLTARPRHLVVLRPPVHVVLDRDAGRHRTTGKIAYRPGEFTAADLDGFLAETPKVGLWLDTTGASPAETVDEILSRRDEARVDGSV